MKRICVQLQRRAPIYMGIPPNGTNHNMKLTEPQPDTIESMQLRLFVVHESSK